MHFRIICLMGYGWLLTGAACNPKLLVPPARAVGGESPAVLPAGAISAGVTGSGIRKANLYGSNDDFKSQLIAADLTGGLGLDVDARVTATAAFMEAPNEQEYFADYFEEAGLDKDLRAVALRLKWNPGQNSFLAFSGGGGFGSWASRGYYSIEAAVIVGFENPYFVPFMNLRSAYNTPMHRDSVRWADSPNWQDSYSKYTQPSHSRELIVGFKVPLTFHEGPNRRAPDPNAPYFTLEFGVLDIEDSKDAFSGSTMAAGLHFPLRRVAE